MSEVPIKELFIEKARLAGAVVRKCFDLSEAVDYLISIADGPVALPDFHSSRHHGLAARLESESRPLLTDNLRPAIPNAAVGITGANFGIAETGTVVLESTAEDIRMASSMPPKHIVLLDQRKILRTSLEANPLLRRFQKDKTASYLAYITGPSRTADIERVLTVGVHGPKELHILLMRDFCDDPMKM